MIFNWLLINLKYHIVIIHGTMFIENYQIMKNEYKDKIDKANVYDAALRTPLEKQLNLSKRFNNNILLKREDLQPVFSFKIRGAYNKMKN